MPRPLTTEVNYIRSLHGAQDALLERIVVHLESIGQAIQIGPEEGRFLQVLIALSGAKSIVEIGTLAGYSTIWMARALPPGGHITTINKDKPHIEMAKGFFAESDVNDRITMLEGDAHDVLPTLNGQYDMVFIDADKISYNDYLDWAEKHIRPGGLIVADNTFLHGMIFGDAPPENIAPSTWHNMRRFNERMADKSIFDSILLPTTEGITIAIKR